MNTLVIGRCPKTAEQFSTFCDKVIITLDHSFKNERHLPELEQYPIEYYKSNISTPYGIFPRVKEILQLIRKYDIDIVFSNTKWDMVAAKIASLLCSKKVVLLATNHNSYAWQNPWAVKKMSTLIKFTTDCYVALASFVYDQIKKNGVDNLILVPNTVGYETWQVKNDYSFKDPFRLVYVAYVCPKKRQSMLVDVLKQLNEKYDVIVDCYGDLDDYVEYVEEIKKKTKDYHLEGRLNFKGKIENIKLRSLLKEYDAYISVSNMEMSPINLMEAQAAGLPVVAACVGGIPDIICDGATGLLFKADDWCSAANQIERLINNQSLREAIGNAARKYVSENYTKVQAGERLKSSILKVINKNAQIITNK